MPYVFLQIIASYIRSIFPKIFQLNSRIVHNFLCQHKTRTIILHTKQYRDVKMAPSLQFFPACLHNAKIRLSTRTAMFVTATRRLIIETTLSPHISALVSFVTAPHLSSFLPSSSFYHLSILRLLLQRTCIPSPQHRIEPTSVLSRSPMNW